MTAQGFEIRKANLRMDFLFNNKTIYLEIYYNFFKIIF